MKKIITFILILLIYKTCLADISRPIDNELQPTPINVKVVLIDVDDIDGASQSFEANLYFELSWNDPRHNLSDINTQTNRIPDILDKNDHGLNQVNIDVLSYPLSKIWHPQINIINQQRIWLSMPDIAEVDSNGNVTYRQKVWGHFSQPLELKEFPFDSQIFEIKLSSVGYDSEKVKLISSTKSKISERFSVPDWNIIDWNVKTTSDYILSDVKAHDVVTFSFQADRRAGYFIGKVIIPLILIVAMSWAVFWIDIKATGTMVTVAITAMLTLIAYRFAIGANLPKIDYMTRLDLFILGSSIMVFASLIQVLITAHFAKSGRAAIAKNIDLWCRWIFPAAFIIIGFTTLAL